MSVRSSVRPDLEGISARDAGEEYWRRHLDAWPDRRLVAAVGAVLSTPKEAPADSFVLHAPLELLARAGLLRHVRPADRHRARQRLVWLAASFVEAGATVAEPSAIDATSLVEVARRLVAALERAELDDVDRTSAWLGAHATPTQLRRLLAAPVASSLAAAAHGSILLHLLVSVAPSGAVPGTVLRGIARELARQPGWRLRWFEDRDGPTAAGAGSLVEALLEVPSVGVPSSPFIYPIMHQAEEMGLAARCLSGLSAAAVDRRLVSRQLSRVAAWSMLQEPPDHAPYGWSHCLTMPQAVMGLAGNGVDISTAAMVAATHVVGFRAALGQRPLTPRYDPAVPDATSVRDALAQGPERAAAVAFHIDAIELDALVTELVTRAAVHHDAHLVKYTLACLDAAAADPEHRRLYLAAAASLGAWWADQPSDGFA